MAKLLLCLVPLAFGGGAAPACSSDGASSKDHVLLQGAARLHPSLSQEQREVTSGKASGCSYVTGKRAVAVVLGRATCGDTRFKKMPRDKRRSLRDFHLTSSAPVLNVFSSSVPPVPPCSTSLTTTKPGGGGGPPSPGSPAGPPSPGSPAPPPDGGGPPAPGPPAPPPTGVTVSCKIHGDPHVTDFGGQTFDVLKPVGDYWLVKSEHLQIQGRYCSPSATGWDSAMGIAVKGTNLPVLTVLSKFNNDAHPFVMIDDKAVMPVEAAGQQRPTNPNFDAGAYKLNFVTAGWSLATKEHSQRSVKIEGQGGLWITIQENGGEMNLDIQVDQALIEGGAIGHCGTLDDHSPEMQQQIALEMQPQQQQQGQQQGQQQQQLRQLSNSSTAAANNPTRPKDLAFVEGEDLLFKHQTCPWIAASPTAGQVLLEQKLAENSFVYTDEICPKIDHYTRECMQAFPGDIDGADDCVVDCCDGADCPAEDDVDSNIESIRVTGAGISVVNGRYLKGKKMHGKDSWNMVFTESNVSRVFAIVHLGDSWILDENYEGRALYFVKSKVLRPPFSGWEIGGGVGPAPRLVAEGPGPAMSLLAAPRSTETFQLCSCSRTGSDEADKQGGRKDKRRSTKDTKTRNKKDKKNKQDKKKRTRAGSRKDKKRNKKDTRRKEKRKQKGRVLLETDLSRENDEDTIDMQATRKHRRRKKKSVVRGGLKDRKKRASRKDKRSDKKQLGYFFISAGESCEEVCDARDAKCDLAALKAAASSVAKCNNAINQIL